MLGLFTIGGIILFVLGIAAIVVSNLRQGGKKIPFSGGLRGLGAMLILAGIPGFLASGLFFNAQAGHYYLVQYVNGKLVTVQTPGIKFKWFGSVSTFKQAMSVGFTSNPEGVEFSGEASPINITFVDAVNATVQLTGRFRMPNDPARLQAVMVEFRNQSNLIQSTLIPALTSATRNSARLIRAQEAVTGQAATFEQAILDQVRNGNYELEAVETRSSRISGSQEITSETDRSVEFGQGVQRDMRIKTGNDGLYLRIQGAIQDYGLEVVQVEVVEVDYDPAFDERLTEQRNAAAQVAVEQQLTLQEEQRKLRIEAQNQANLVERQGELQLKQAEQQIQAETLAKVAEERQKQLVTEAETKRQQAEINLQTEELQLQIVEVQAQQTVKTAEAEARARELAIAADNGLQSRLDAAVLIAEKLAQTSLVPSVYIGGGDGGGAASADATLGLLNTYLVQSIMGADPLTEESQTTVASGQ